jgi:hypothetical protein
MELETQVMISERLHYLEPEPPEPSNGHNLDPLGNGKSKTTDMVTQTRTHSPSNEIAPVDATVE